MVSCWFPFGKVFEMQCRTSREPESPFALTVQPRGDVEHTRSADLLFPVLTNGLLRSVAGVARSARPWMESSRCSALLISRAICPLFFPSLRSPLFFFFFFVFLQRAGKKAKAVVGGEDEGTGGRGGGGAGPAAGSLICPGR